ncbi:MAG: O-antigen ligase family protein [Bdellovibrionales bacterium]
MTRAILNKGVTATLYAYMFALTCSIAGMEAFSWLSALLFLLAWGASRLEKKPLNTFRINGDLFLWLFWCVALLGALFGPTKSFEVKKFIVADLRWILLIYAFSFIWAQRWDRFKSIIPTLFFFAGLVAIYAIVQVPTGLELAREVGNPKNAVGEYWRSHGFFYSTMTYSYSFGMIFCLMLALWIYKVFDGLVGKYLLPITTVLIGISLVLSFTRGLWLALAAAVFAMLYTVRRKWGYWLIGGGTVLVLLAMAVSSVFRERVTSIVDFENASNVGRLQVWQGNWAMFLDNPILGVGHRQNTEFLPKYYEQIGLETDYVSNAHNTYLQILGGMGLLGLLFYIGFMFLFLKTAWVLWRDSQDKLLKSVGLGSLGAMICLHVGGMTQVNIFDGEVNHVFVFIVGILMAANFQHKSIISS